MTIFHIWLLGFTGSMGLCAAVIRPWKHRATTEELVEVTIGAMFVSAFWPLTLIAILVAVSDQ